MFNFALVQNHAREAFELGDLLRSAFGDAVRSLAKGREASRAASDASAENGYP